MNRFTKALREGMEAARILESKEPEYRFIKNVGWVPSFEHYPEASRRIGNYIVTATVRDPLPGEYYFEQYAKAGNPELVIMDAMEDAYWKPKFEQLGYDQLMNTIPKCTWPLHASDNYVFVVMTVVPV